jgi:hypothetical protein
MARAVDVTVSCEVTVPPFGFVELGLKLQVVPAGAPEHARLIAWLNPPLAARVTV